MYAVNSPFDEKRTRHSGLLLTILLSKIFSKYIFVWTGILVDFQNKILAVKTNCYFTGKIKPKLL